VRGCSILNGDGLADLVLERAGPGQRSFRLNLGNYTFSARKVIAGLPSAISATAAVRWADLNGNGTTDLIYADHEASPRLQVADLGELLGWGATPNALVTIRCATPIQQAWTAKETKKEWRRSKREIPPSD
jgi:hypothetical protein